MPGTPKDRVVYGADVLLPCASLAPGLAEQPQESRKTSSCGVHRNASDTCPRWEQGSPPTEWCRLPYGVASQGTDIRYSTPQDEPRLGASLTGATPRPRTDPASEPDAFPNMARSRRSRPFLDASCPVRSLCVGTSLRESRNTSRGVLENVTRSLGNVTLLLILSQDVRSWPGNVPQTGAEVWAVPRFRL